jgi:hypothetical protein
MSSSVKVISKELVVPVLHSLSWVDPINLGQCLVQCCEANFCNDVQSHDRSPQMNTPPRLPSAQNSHRVPDPVRHARFGTTVAIDDNTIVVGAPSKNGVGAEGDVYLCDRSTGSLKCNPAASDARIDYYFGQTI